MSAAAPGTALALLAVAALSSAQETLPMDRGRIYPKPASEVWQAARETLAELGMKVDELDLKHQLVVTKFRGYGGGTVPGPSIPGYRADRFQLHVFVSPYAEPARVHVGSVSELSRMAGGTSTLYGGGDAERWFLDALDRRLGVPGRAIPVDAEARRRLAAELGHPPCEPGKDGAADAVSPARIKASEVEVIYPGREGAEAHAGVVVLGIHVGEDGGIYSISVAEGSAPETRFRNSARGAAWLLRYVPLRLQGCPAPTMITYTFNYSLARRGRP